MTTPNQKTGHTATPWKVQVAAGSVSVCCPLQQIAQMVEFRAAAQSAVNAAFIVRACNSHDALVAENKALADALQNLLDAQTSADKQWLGLNMANPHQKRAHDIISAARIVAIDALNNRAALKLAQE